MASFQVEWEVTEKPTPVLLLFHNIDNTTSVVILPPFEWNKLIDHFTKLKEILFFPRLG